MGKGVVSKVVADHLMPIMVGPGGKQTRVEVVMNPINRDIKLDSFMKIFQIAGKINFKSADIIIYIYDFSTTIEI